jgi:hypothetical protein
MFDWIIERGKEGSTWRGIVAVLTAAGVHFSPELQEAIISTGLGLIGVIAIVWKERGAKDAKPAA